MARVILPEARQFLLPLKASVDTGYTAVGKHYIFEGSRKSWEYRIMLLFPGYENHFRRKRCIHD